MSNYQRREWLEQLESLYNPSKGCFQAGIIRLGGFVKDQFYCDYRYPTVELPNLLAEYFRDKVDLFAWYSWGDGLRYEFDRVTPTSVSQSVVGLSSAPVNARDPGQAFGQIQAGRREEIGRQGGSRFGDNVRDAIREIDDLLTGRPDKKIVVLFHDIEWEFPADSSQGVNLVPLVRRWPDRCLGHHLVIFASNPVAEWIPRLITGQGVADLEIAGPTVDEIKLRLIYEHLVTNKPVFAWQDLAGVAAYFAEEYAQPNRSYRSFVNDLTTRGDMVYNADFVKLNHTDETAIDYHAIDVEAFETYLDDHLIGQTRAKRWAVTELATLRDIGVPSQREKPKPIISVLFAGPSGVGKTELATIICRHIFKREPLVIRCETYQEQDIAKLLGSPPGYVGYNDNAGILVRYLQEKPYGLIVLDEFERGPEKLREFFMGVLDPGVAEIPSGGHLIFGQTIIIATSNAGSGVDNQIGAEMISPEVRKASYDEAIRRMYPPHLMGRFQNHYIVFDRFVERERLEIARLYVNLYVHKTRKEDLNLSEFAVSATDVFYTQLSARCPETTGARRIEQSVNGIMRSVHRIYARQKKEGCAGSIQLDWLGKFPTASGQEIEIPQE